MKAHEIKSPVFDLERVRAALQSPEYKARVEQSMRDIESLKSKAVIDRSRLFVPIDF